MRPDYMYTSRTVVALSTAALRAARYYVEAQERELLSTLDGLIAEETWAPADAASGARCRRRCGATTNEPLTSSHGSHQAYVQQCLFTLHVL